MQLRDFIVENLGISYPDTFQGFGTAFSGFDFCTYGIGDTEDEALNDCLEMLAQSCGFDVTDEIEEKIRKAYGHTNGVTTAAEALDECDDPAYFHVGIYWNEVED